MKLIAGLGNPGAKYRETLHNIGFEVVNELARRHGVEFESAPAEALIAKIRRPGETLEQGILLVKPLTFMNLSGRAIGELQRYFKIDVDELLVIVDDINLPAGQLRARPGGSAGGHNGLKSVEGALQSQQYARLRIGVGPLPQGTGDWADYVLAPFSPPQLEEVEALMPAMIEAVAKWLKS